MVKIKNINLSEGLISMDCYKEGNLAEHFHLVVNADNFEIVSTTLSQPSIYSRQAIEKVKSLSQQGPLPKEAISMWC